MTNDWEPLARRLAAWGNSLSLAWVPARKWEDVGRALARARAEFAAIPLWRGGWLVLATSHLAGACARVRRGDRDEVVRTFVRNCDSDFVLCSAGWNWLRPVGRWARGG
jgi:hypothetical protein